MIGQRRELPGFDAQVECHQVGGQSVLRKLQFLQLGGQAQAMHQAEAQHRRARIQSPAQLR